VGDLLLKTQTAPFMEGSQNRVAIKYVTSYVKFGRAKSVPMRVLT
jgi:hypothetical protein